MTDPRPILVIGGTGMLGRPVAEALLAAGETVRVMSRDAARAQSAMGPAFTFVQGDVSDASSLDRALDGCKGVHVNLKGTSLESIERTEIGGSEAIARAAVRAGVGQLTYLSGAGIEAADPRLLPAKIKQGAEAAIRASGVPFTILRASHFMESLDLFVRGSRIELLIPQPKRIHYLAAADFGRQVVCAFSDPRAIEKAYTLLGPEAFTMREALEIYARELRPDLSIRTLPLPLARMASVFVRDPGLKLAIKLFEAFSVIEEPARTADAETVLGQAETTLAQWCEGRRHNRQ